MSMARFRSKSVRGEFFYCERNGVIRQTPYEQYFQMASVGAKTRSVGDLSKQLTNINGEFYNYAPKHTVIHIVIHGKVMEMVEITI